MVLRRRARLQEVAQLRRFHQHYACISMNRGRLVLTSLLILDSAVFALSIAATIVESETPLTHAESLHLDLARNTLWVSLWLLQIVTIWSLWRTAAAVRRSFRIPLSIFGSVLCSFVGGILLFTVAEHGWYWIAAQLR